MVMSQWLLFALVHSEQLGEQNSLVQIEIGAQGRALLLSSTETVRAGWEMYSKTAECHIGRARLFHLTDVTLEQCQTKCENTNGCNAVSSAPISTDPLAKRSGWCFGCCHGEESCHGGAEHAFNNETATCNWCSAYGVHCDECEMDFYVQTRALLFSSKEIVRAGEIDLDNIGMESSDGQLNSRNGGHKTFNLWPGQCTDNTLTNRRISTKTGSYQATCSQMAFACTYSGAIQEQCPECCENATVPTPLQGWEKIKTNKKCDQSMFTTKAVSFEDCTAQCENTAGCNGFSYSFWGENSQTCIGCKSQSMTGELNSAFYARDQR